MDERGREVEPALHAARVGADPPVDRARDVHQVEDLVHPPADLLAPQAVETPLQTEELAAGLLRIERHVLQRDPDAQADRLGIGADVVPGHHRSPGARAKQSTEHPDQGRLAGAVLSEEPVDLPFFDREVDSVDRVNLPVTTDQVLGDDGKRRTSLVGAGVSGSLHTQPHPAYSLVSTILPVAQAMTIEPLTPERRRQQTRDHLLEAAARVFGERGYHGASLDDIAAAAGFTKGAVYSNFKSKEDLFLALLESRFASELEDLKAVLAQSEVGADDRLSDFVTLIVEQPNDPARVTWGTLYEEFHLYARRNPEARARLAELDRRDVASVAEILRTERERLHLDPATSPEDAARITLALTRGIAMMQTTDPDAIDQRFLESMLEFLARALTS